MRIRRILACVDGSRTALRAAEAAADLSESTGAAVRVVFVVEPSGPADGTGAMTGSGEAVLDHIARAGALRDLRFETRLLRGVPFEAILEEAAEFEPDLIVMGRTGRTGPGRALLGSEVERVLEFTRWPVLVVPSVAIER